MSSIFRAIFGYSEEKDDSPTTVHDIIEACCERVQNAKLIEDRLTSLHQLKIGARAHPFEVATIALGTLTNHLITSHHDECILATLDILFILFTDPEKKMKHDILTQFVEMFSFKQDNVDALVCGLENTEFNVRFKCTQLLCCLVQNSPQTSIATLTNNPLAISALISLLEDVREAIRNEALFLLGLLTRNQGSNRSHICRLVAFQSGFEYLINTICNEGGLVAGGVVAQDCLVVIGNLLISSTQEITLKTVDNAIRQIFLESKCAHSISDLFPSVSYFTDADGVSSTPPEPLNDQSVRNIIGCVRVLNALVCGYCLGNVKSIMNNCQLALLDSGIVDKLIDWITFEGNTANQLTNGTSFRSECLFCLSQIGYKCSLVQTQIFDRFDSRLFSFIESHQPIPLKLNAYKCLVSLCKSNSKIKRRIRDHLLMEKTDESPPLFTQLVDRLNVQKERHNADVGLSVNCLCLLLMHCFNRTDDEDLCGIVESMFQVALNSSLEVQARIGASSSLIGLLTGNSRILKDLGEKTVELAEQIVNILSGENNEPLLSSFLMFICCLLTFFDPMEQTFLKSNESIVSMLIGRCSNDVGKRILHILDSSVHCPSYISALGSYNHDQQRPSNAHQPCQLPIHDLYIDDHVLNIHSQLLPTLSRRVVHEFEVNDSIITAIIKCPFEDEYNEKLNKLMADSELMYKQSNEYFNQCQQYYSSLCDAKRKIEMLSGEAEVKKLDEE